MSPFISIIMPVYNNERYFPNAVQSVINQSFEDWELIVVDDGSTDGTPQIADSFADRDSRVRVIHQNNQWVYASVNNGTAVANGKYVFMFNSDDLLNREALQRIHDVAVIDDADIVMFNLSVNHCDEDQNVLEKEVDRKNAWIKDDFSYKGKEIIHKKWFDFMKLGLVGHQCFYKATLAKAHKMPNETYAGDFLYNVILADHIGIAAGTSYEVYMFMNYGREDMNASVKKYYGYEHDMYNEMYYGYKELFTQWGIYDREKADYLSARRLASLSSEFRGIIKQNLSLEKKIETILDYAGEKIVYEFALEADRIEEWESRILSICRDMFVVEIPEADCKYYFLYELLDSLLRYEKTSEDLDRIKNSVYHEMNPMHIGETFLRKINI